MAKNIYLFIYLLFCCAGVSDAQSGHTGSAILRNKVALTYTSQIGVRELTGNNDGKAVEAYLRYCSLSKGAPWCAAFVCWVYGQNNILNPRSGYCPDLFKHQYVIWTRNAYVNTQPTQGDLFGIYFLEKNRIAHTGFVDRWTTTQVQTVEGNTNQAGSREGDGVYHKIRLTRQIYAVARFIK
ncbi:peptidoglycan-binding protein [Mucilaginibacter panaciglaebae]|uniref:CHAP domain-containing protein n=1 Tax=Mucilaginibacter panaciglaebae TaxID=502331 RepID=A0ABP7WNM5_9SPHI